MQNMVDIYNKIPARYPELTGKVAIVTGSSRGIGKGIALRLTKEGMRVVLNGRSLNTLNKTVEELRNLGADVIGIPADLGVTEAIDDLVNRTIAHFGSIDLVVNNAAIVKRAHFFDVTEQLLDQELAANIRGPYHCSFQTAKYMRDHKISGNIIHISSVGGLRAHWRGLPYDVTKGAIDAMTRAMALELAQYGIRVNAIAPGAILTERRPDLEDPRMIAVSNRIPLKRFGTGLEIGAMTSFLASEDAGYITGQVLYVDGGITAQLSPRGQDI
jgi:NAD(P)-dependent dehydrogenase (short-subunit alcohol dehydrogenase family)